MNIGVVFFGFIAIYLIVCVYMYFTSEHISGYEVIKGNLATDHHYTGIALRTEQVYDADKAGYVNYYAAEGEKVSVLSTVYTIDENGEMSSLLQENSGELNLGENDYNEIEIGNQFLSEQCLGYGISESI
ncbi:MAG: HlyD family efflux transporter periplasmic adaptor subunit [Eubacteriales bacterium]